MRELLFASCAICCLFSPSCLITQHDISPVHVSPSAHRLRDFTFVFPAVRAYRKRAAGAMPRLMRQYTFTITPDSSDVYTEDAFSS